MADNEKKMLTPVQQEYQALQKQGKAAEAKSVKSRFEKAWQYAEFNLASFCSL